MNTRKRNLRRLRHIVVVAASAALVGSVSVAAADPSSTPRPGPGLGEGRVDLVEVDTSSAAEREALAELGLDVESVAAPTTSVLVHDRQDLDALESAGLEVTTRVRDLGARNARARADEAERVAKLPDGPAVLQARSSAPLHSPGKIVEGLLPPVARADGAAMPAAASSLPSGRVSYRTLPEINNELRYLARTYPDRVELFELPHTSLLGTPVLGIELTRDVATRQGKPAMLMSGIHHAREWPTADYTMELAWELLLSDGSDPRVSGLLDQVRVVFVPVVNPDGYVISRSLTQEFKRKNCRVEPHEVPGPNDCANPDNFDFGVDLNRNYGSYWGSIGSSWDRTRSNYRGTAPFSEPEIQNMRELWAAHHFTVALNNHTPDERILRAPADLNEPDPVDEAPYQALAEHLAEPPNYRAGPWDEIYYNGSGVAEQYAFYSTGSWAFTPELDLGEGGFHPPYDGVVAEWDQHRETYLRAMEAAADPSGHAVITGTAPRRAELTITNAFTMYTAPPQQPDGTQGPLLPFETRHESTIEVGDDGTFTWHVNASVRPAEFISALVSDDWTIGCALRPGRSVRQEVDVTVMRGEEATIAFDDCVRRPRPRPRRP